VLMWNLCFGQTRRIPLLSQAERKRSPLLGAFFLWLCAGQHLGLPGVIGQRSAGTEASRCHALTRIGSLLYVKVFPQAFNRALKLVNIGCLGKKC
jgi:hypothetical protein